MAKEVLELEVKSNIGDVTKATEGLTSAIGDSASEVKKLSGDIDGAQANVSNLGSVFGNIKNIVSSVGNSFGSAFNILKGSIQQATGNTEGLNKESTKLTGNIDTAKKSTKKLAEETKVVGKETIKVGAETKKVGKEIDKLSNDTKGVVKETKDLGSAAKKSSKGFDLIGKASRGIGTAFKAMGIGALVALLLALREAMERNQKVMDIFNTILDTISTTFNQVVSALTDTVKWVTESTDSVDALGRVFKGIGTIIKNVVMIALTPFRLSLIEMKTTFAALQLGWEKLFGDDESIKAARQNVIDTAEEFVALKDSLVNSVKEIGSAGKSIVGSVGEAISEVGAIYEKAADGITQISIKGNYEQAKATVAATKAALFAGAEFAKLNAQFLKEQEDERKIRDNVNLTFKERIEANERLSESIKKQQKLQKEQVQIQINAAALLVEQNASDENKLAFLEAQNAMLETIEATEAQLSEQLTNKVGLENELGEVKNEILLAGLEGLALELSELERGYELKLEMARKAGEGSAAITDQYEKQKADIIKGYQTEGERSFKELSENQVKWAEMTAAERMNIASTTAGNLSKILGEETAAGKAAAIIQATIDTYKSAQASYASLAGIPVVGPVLGGIAAAAAVASGIANVKAIAGAGGGGGGNITAPPTTTATAPAPQMMSGAFDISGGVAPEATKAFVVTDEMTNSQNQLANIRRRATI